MTHKEILDRLLAAEAKGTDLETLVAAGDIFADPHFGDIPLEPEYADYRQLNRQVQMWRLLLRAQQAEAEFNRLLGDVA